MSSLLELPRHASWSPVALLPQARERASSSCRGEGRIIIISAGHLFSVVASVYRVTKPSPSSALWVTSTPTLCLRVLFAAHTAAMAKLYFRHGAMSSSKSLQLLAVAHNYREQGKRVLLLKPRVDSRFAAQAIVSRAGLDAEADLLLDADTVLDGALFVGLHCVLVDEAQFLSAFVIDQLRLLTKTHSVPVICYGLVRRGRAWCKVTRAVHSLTALKRTRSLDPPIQCAPSPIPPPPSPLSAPTLKHASLRAPSG